ncbi:MAG: AIM24 family protein, partial [Myxococcales bacterium]|nr:AIM24 family protein [Myxococcales bacterium]
FGGMRGLFFSGEGLVCDFTGQGKIYLQTRNAGALAAFLHPFRPVETKSS